MKISSYAIAMQSQHEFKAAYAKTESLNEWQEAKTTDQQPPDKSIQQWVQDQLKISDQAREALKKEVLSMGGAADSDDGSELAPIDKQKIRMLESLLSILLGRKVKFKIPKLHTDTTDQAMAELRADISKIQAARPQETGSVRQGWGLAYERHESYQESEKLSFDATGIIKTADGREIDFQIQLKMSREFAVRNDLSVKAGDALFDPLVINYDGPAAQLTDRKFAFDLDADGDMEQISFLKSGSGFLALDSNNDGVINNGKELFGPATGNGFDELAKYDQDQNGWIDENDPIFDKLRIWTKDANGKDILFALGQMGIGAIFLGNIDAEFGLKGSANQLNGEARTAGVFLRENGTAGIIQQIDLTA